MSSTKPAYYLPLLSFFMSLGSNSARAEPDLVISEVYANSPGSVSDSGKEWVEVTNVTAETTIVLDGAVLSRLDGTAQLNSGHYPQRGI